MERKAIGFANVGVKAEAQQYSQVVKREKAGNPQECLSRAKAKKEVKEQKRAKARIKEEEKASRRQKESFKATAIAVGVWP